MMIINFYCYCQYVILVLYYYYVRMLAVGVILRGDIDVQRPSLHVQIFFFSMTERKMKTISIDLNKLLLNMDLLGITFHRDYPNACSLSAQNIRITNIKEVVCMCIPVKFRYPSSQPHDGYVV